ncbi:hypothetical protein NUG13_11750 [Bacillus subtilis]|uniref:Uncharacterized protein n=2 Tax=Zhangjivirus TaxID=3044867 RepID=A0AAE9G6P3_9CAUD|nr:MULTISPECIES: hypothetical protein [Bacillus subtilis group]YP_010681693.1 hypothetical protein PQE76_gp075 [Bacillus phage vB_BsuS_PJN02]YP_010740202.1 hypothetical protein P9294_gp185 [Bacillus phage FADO]MCR4362001.1 hypothetical protein [Bacillus subtilis]UNH58418.1 hypothetical protein [Bacillus phage vB_BsuS_PJN02]UNY48900.1 hypothetical protein fado_185 [Bacillus phage FADO]UQB84380.1 hypothetical protein KMZ31_19870 [Bacillus amyloliquefaciens]WOF33017.1 hypothetical protein OEJ84
MAKATYYGLVQRLEYKVEESSLPTCHPDCFKPRIVEVKHTEGKQLIHECEFEGYRLKQGEKVMFPDNIEAVILEVMRHPEGGYTCITDYVAETIQDERTQQTLIKSQEELKHAIKCYYNEKSIGKSRNKKFWKRGV